MRFSSNDFSKFYSIVVQEEDEIKKKLKKKAKKKIKKNKKGVGGEGYS